MPSLSQAKTLGGVGSLLVLLGFVPSVGFVLAIVGFVLILVAVKNVSESVNEPSIFNDMIIAVLLAIVGLVVFGLIVVAAIFSVFSNFGQFGTGTPPTTIPSGIAASIGLLIAGLVVVWVFYLVSAIFIRKSYDKIGMRLNVNMFHTTGLLYLIGAALTIVFVGLLIVLIAEILQIVAFFSIPDQLPSSTPPQQTWGPPSPTPMPPPAPTQ